MEKQECFRRRAILFFVSQCVTLFGSQIVQMAIVWYVTLETGSGAWVAAFSVCSYLPQFLISFPGGVWADRYSRKGLIIGADMAIALVTAIVMLLMPRMSNTPALLMALLMMSAARSAGAGIQTPAVSAAVSQLVPEAHRMCYNGINAAMQSFVQFAAPAAAVLVLTAGSIRAALMIDIVTAIFGVALLGGISLPKREVNKADSSAFSDIGAGVRYACARRAVRSCLMIYGLFVFLTVPAGYLSGLFVSREFGDTYWYLTAVELVGFGGMMAGGLLMSVWGGWKSRNLTLAAGLASFGVMAIAMGMSRSLAVYLAGMALYGVALTMVQTTLTTMLQENAKEAMQGRMFGLMGALYASCYPLGMALFGPLADVLPIRGIMILSGMMILMIAGAVCQSGRLSACREMKDGEKP